MRHFTKVPNEDVAFSLLQEAVNAGTVAIDTETNGRDIRDATGECYGVSVAYDTTAFYMPLRHTNGSADNYDLHRFLPVLQQVLDNATVIYHNAKYDLVSLRRLGLKTLGHRFVDTMVLAHKIDENRPWSGKGLDSCVKYYCKDVEGKKIEKTSDYMVGVKLLGYEGLTPELTAEYAMWDAWITLQLYLKLEPLAAKEKLGPTWKHSAKMVERLIHMEDWGVRIDQQLCKDMAERGRSEMEKIVLSLDGLNPGSTKDLHKLLIDEMHLPVFKLTPGGKPSFDKFAMQEYELVLSRIESELATKILAYRGWQKSVSSNYEAYLKLLSPDGRLRPNYKMHGTTTGRLSCEKPNLQQIPKRGDKPWNGQMKQAFIPEDGYTLIEGDYSQLEFRLSAAFAKETKLLDIFADPDRDVFTEMAIELEMKRQDVKTLTYSIMYGAGVRRIQNVFGVSKTRAEEIRNNFYRAYPALQAATKFASQYVTANGRIPLWSGRNRHFVHPSDDAHKAYNSICQGGAADIVERTMLRCASNGLDTNDCRMLLQVHDSIVFEVRTELLSKFRPMIKEVMENVQPNFGVKFPVSIHMWGE